MAARTANSITRRSGTLFSSAILLAASYSGAASTTLPFSRLTLTGTRPSGVPTTTAYDYRPTIVREGGWFKGGIQKKD